MNAKKLILTILLSLVLLGCTGEKFSPPTPSDSIDGTGAAVSQEPRKKSYSLITNQQYLPLLSVALNYDYRTNTQIQTDYNNYKASLPEFGDAILTSVASRQYTNLANRMCSQAITQDLSQSPRVVFRFLDFTRAPNQSAGQVDAFLKHLGVRLTGRSLNSEEIKILSDFYKAHSLLVPQDANGTRQVAGAVCTVLASSLQTIIQ